MPDDTQALLDFLKSLDESSIDVSDWEAKFIESNLDRDSFSPKQREAIMKLMTKYGKKIGYY